jgi:hypothetical protein
MSSLQRVAMPTTLSRPTILAGPLQKHNLKFRTNAMVKSLLYQRTNKVWLQLNRNFSVQHYVKVNGQLQVHAFLFSAKLRFVTILSEDGWAQKRGQATQGTYLTSKVRPVAPSVWISIIGCVDFRISSVFKSSHVRNGLAMRRFPVPGVYRLFKKIH